MYGSKRSPIGAVGQPKQLDIAAAEHQSQPAMANDFSKKKSRKVGALRDLSTLSRFNQETKLELGLMPLAFCL